MVCASFGAGLQTSFRIPRHTSLLDLPSDTQEFCPGAIAQAVEDVAALKRDILLQAAQCSRGELEHDKNPIAALVERLEAQESSNKVEDLNGKWNLIYSSTQLFLSSPFFMAARDVCMDGEEVDRFLYFCKLHREALAFTSIGQVSQLISHVGDSDPEEATLTSEFESNVAVAPGLPIIVKGTIESKATITEVSGCDIKLKMDTVKIKRGTSNIPFANTFLDRFEGLPTRDMSNFLENTIPKSVRDYKAPEPMFRTTYLDSRVRVSRNVDNELFIYAKCGAV